MTSNLTSRLRLRRAFALPVGLALACGGCDEAATDADTDAAAGEVHGDHDDHEGHDHAEGGHPTEGPHHGGLIELGDEEYHAELVHKGETVTIHILDAAAKTEVPIAAAEVVVNAVIDGKPRQFSLAAVDPEDGKASQFASTDPALGAALDAEGSKARLTVAIDGNSFNGAIVHDHQGHDHGGHEGHDHGGHDHGGHDHD